MHLNRLIKLIKRNYNQGSTDQNLGPDQDQKIKTISDQIRNERSLDPWLQQRACKNG